ncbi:MAG: Gfo/Idh/MocA family oxidoreductase, partial [Chloroflexi bacterium]|nr:Gfo/Idh/MocA family oxidoreductase [Chloroflexota bacterium]
MNIHSKKLKAALIGCGRIGADTPEQTRAALPKGWLPVCHAEAIVSTPGLELAAVCDTDAERAQAAARLFGVPAVYTDYQQMIRDIRPDLLAVATRTAGRCELLAFAAENGVRGIHAEKPLGRSLLECRRALQAVARHQVALSYGTTRRYMDVYRSARQMVTEGAVGDVLQITIEFGRTLLLWNHPHSVDLLLFFSGCRQIEYVQATCVLPPEGVQRHMVDADPVLENAFVRFANGINGAITAATGLNVRIAGTLGNLVVAADGSWIELAQKARPEDPYQLHQQRWEPSPTQSGTQRAFSELAAAVRDHRPLSIA